MNGQTLQIGLYAILSVLLVMAMITDWRSRIIENWLNAIIACLAPVLWFAMGKAIWPDMAIQLGIGVAVFGIFTVFFMIGAMGGGDVKLLGALGLWFPFTPLINMLLLMSILGGLLTLVMWGHHKMTKSQKLLEIPYGLAIAAAALWSINEPYLNQFGR